MYSTTPQATIGPDPFHMMMEANLPAKYAKTAQLLMQKRSELEQVFGEARALESENTQLQHENREMRSRNMELESAAKSMSFELAALEAQVRKQQMRLQQYIDLEAAGHGSNKPRPQDAQRMAALSDEVATWKNKHELLSERLQKEQEAKTRMQATIDNANGELAALRAAAASSQSTMESTTLENQSLRADVAQLRKELEILREQQRGVAKDTELLSRLEADALTGLRDELMGLSSENHRLLDALEDERSRHHELRTQHESYDDLIRRQRFLSDGQLKICRDEVAALNAQNDALMAEVRRLTSEKEQLRKQAAAAAVVAATGGSPSVANANQHAPTDQHLPVAPPKPPVVHRGTMTTEVLLPVADDSSEALMAREVAKWEAVAHEKDAEIARLKAHVDVLVSDNDKLAALLREKSEASALREEMIHLQKLEIERLQTDVHTHTGAVATPLERLVLSPSASRDEQHQLQHPSTSTSHALPTAVVPVDDLSTIERHLSKVLVAGTKALSEAEDVMRDVSLYDGAESDTATSACGSDTDVGSEAGRRAISASSMHGRAVVPIVPFHEMRHPSLNRFMEMIGGLRHIVRQVTVALRTASRRRLFSSKWQPSTESAVARPVHGYGSGYHGLPVSADAPPTAAEMPRPESGPQRPMFDVDAWLSTRRKGGVTAAGVSVGLGADAAVRGPPQSVAGSANDEEAAAMASVRRSGDASYRAGFTLMDSLEQLRKTPRPVRTHRHYQ